LVRSRSSTVAVAASLVSGQPGQLRRRRRPGAARAPRGPTCRQPPGARPRF